MAEGFAWSYFYGYLLMMLPGLKDRIGALDDQICKPVSHKLYLFLPKSGKMLDAVNKLPGVEKYMQLTWKQDIAGNVGRDYNSFMYKVTRARQDWYFVGEYITPLAVLKDMEMGRVAGMSSEARVRQVTKLYSRLEEILSHKHAQELNGRWRLFRYDDSSAVGSVKMCSDIVDAVREDVEELQSCLSTWCCTTTSSS